MDFTSPWVITIILIAVLVGLAIVSKLFTMVSRLLPLAGMAVLIVGVWWVGMYTNAFDIVRSFFPA
ncbi:hypothetical protein V5R04_07190 [Jonesiaceae bacterium BS-20]|uniref:Uncharacterized protein n=1 Tax=Jonesiaceae bacterium BS-20 TaxID=3120821 RepID=A0AAU7DXV7_9MICO